MIKVFMGKFKCCFYGINIKKNMNLNKICYQHTNRMILRKTTQINLVLDGRVFKATFGELMFFSSDLEDEGSRLYIFIHNYVYVRSFVGMYLHNLFI